MTWMKTLRPHLKKYLKEQSAINANRKMPTEGPIREWMNKQKTTKK